MSETSLFSAAEKPHILVVDDDDRIRQLLSKYLIDNGFLVATAKDAQHAEDILKKAVFDALVVDVMMPGKTGFEFTKDLRRVSDLPVLLLTALGETDSRISGLEAGADDYLAKPFEPKELLLRLKAILRRRPETTKDLSSFRVGPWKYDATLNDLVDGEERVRLTDVESNLLEILARHAGQILSRDDLARLCNMEGNERTIDVQVTRLRRKLKDDSRAPRYLQTIRGQGYMLRLEKD